MNIKKNTLAKFFGTTRQTINNWEKEKEKYAIAFFNKYFDEEEIVEFINSGAICRLEDNMDALDLQKKIKQQVMEILKEKLNLKDSNPEKNVFIAFGKFLEQLPNEEKMKLKELKFKEYIANEKEEDDSFRSEYINFLESLKYDIKTIHHNLNVMEYYFFGAENYYKFYFLKEIMWIFDRSNENENKKKYVKRVQKKNYIKSFFHGE